MIAPFTAGSTLDVMARFVSDRRGSAFGHNVVVDNRPGANGVIGIDLVAKAPPDGYTMLLTTGSFTGNIVIYKKLPYDGTRDFAPMTQIARSYGMVLVVNPGRAAQPEVKARLDDLGLVGVGSTPGEFAKFLRDDIELQKSIVKRAGIPRQ